MGTLLLIRVIRGADADLNTRPIAGQRTNRQSIITAQVLLYFIRAMQVQMYLVLIEGGVKLRIEHHGGCTMVCGVLCLASATAILVVVVAIRPIIVGRVAGCICVRVQVVLCAHAIVGTANGCLHMRNYRSRMVFSATAAEGLHVRQYRGQMQVGRICRLQGLISAAIGAGAHDGCCDCCRRRWRRLRWGGCRRRRWSWWRR